jgi:hypothetical protein
VGILVISTIDNILRPIFSRWGSLDLPVWCWSFPSSAAS